MKKVASIKEYIDAQPKQKRATLENFRKIIRKAAPAAQELISYGMPAFQQ